MYLILMDGFYREYRIIWYINHGEGGTAKNRMKSELRSQVQGIYIRNYMYAFIVWGMQVGWWIDIKSYAMSYGRIIKKARNWM
jgi:hypothetical protein